MDFPTLFSLEISIKTYILLFCFVRRLAICDLRNNIFLTTYVKKTFTRTDKTFNRHYIHKLENHKLSQNFANVELMILFSSKPH